MVREDRMPRHRILVVDDEESTRLLLARLMAQELRAEPQLAGTCEQALRFAGNAAYDAILLDLLMPGIGGLGVLKQIRAASPNQATPVIVVSVLADEATVAGCISAGADAHHAKPIRRAELVATVKALIVNGRPKPRRAPSKG
jgi:DNA-binding response OmpR family regulator